ncbi:PTS sugar transporter subunit IIB [Vibrio sp. S11_S32]|uniref:PTS sugar transporter subunit IIB n=1 Tax=Vibrio sp. S11_S32 TaxID=2720225 RepID=UPI00168113AD|nr:PTS sugar transporter subunit IIB [Vibrio sp. S11_S32]MBD1574867.1 PTS sugar transporter subunit IIB [Vibrio sp. S11_S32]
MKKILLLCNAGMSTSMVVKKMKESAQAKGIDVEIQAYGAETFQDHLNSYDIFLLGPQIRFKKAEFQAIANGVGKRVEVIDMMDYGMIKGEKILEDTLKLMD